MATALSHEPQRLDVARRVLSGVNTVLRTYSRMRMSTRRMRNTTLPSRGDGEQELECGIQARLT